MLKIDVITIFPQIFDNITDFGVIKEGKAKNLCSLIVYNLRDFSTDRHKKVDNRPYGGGPGMIMTAQPVDDAIGFIKDKNKIQDKNLQKTILLSPHGSKLEQKTLRELSKLENIILVCGRYEGVDERIKELLIDMEISIGDYILTGGEIPAMVIIDGVIRLLEGVVGKKESLVEESFENNLLDFPQYTRPEVYRGVRVPEILLKGNHKLIEDWRKKQALEITRKLRPDLFDKNF
ncbi:MAG: tRNA (guanosine(37)-N1)-methyltransferase TrmD [Actinobacteria bacterium]|nr:tRNA (guanosine(37)-N1)-methyltransferase TrmD [Actinomycetota bacterium]